MKQQQQQKGRNGKARGRAPMPLAAKVVDTIREIDGVKDIKIARGGKECRKHGDGVHIAKAKKKSQCLLLTVKQEPHFTQNMRVITQNPAMVSMVSRDISFALGSRGISILKL